MVLESHEYTVAGTPNMRRNKNTYKYIVRCNRLYFVESHKSMYRNNAVMVVFGFPWTACGEPWRNIRKYAADVTGCTAHGMASKIGNRAAFALLALGTC